MIFFLKHHDVWFSGWKKEMKGWDDVFLFLEVLASEFWSEWSRKEKKEQRFDDKASIEGLIDFFFFFFILHLVTNRLHSLSWLGLFLDGGLFPNAVAGHRDGVFNMVIGEACLGFCVAEMRRHQLCMLPVPHVNVVDGDPAGHTVLFTVRLEPGHDLVLARTGPCCGVLPIR